LNAVEILRPEVNVRSSHKNQTTSIQIFSIARGTAVHGLGDLKIGPKGELDTVQVAQCPKALNYVLGPSSHIPIRLFVLCLTNAVDPKPVSILA
jgi:hypothetical protein